MAASVEGEDQGGADRAYAGNNFWLGEGAKAGVCVHAPPVGEEPLDEAKEEPGNRRHTVYIELIVDGQIVDLNRIPLPPDTPIVDKRFQDDGPAKP